MIFGLTVTNYIKDPEQYTLCIRENKLESRLRFPHQSTITLDTIKSIIEQAEKGNVMAGKIYQTLTNYQLGKPIIVKPVTTLIDQYSLELNHWVIESIHDNVEYQQRVFAARQLVKDSAADLTGFKFTKEPPTFLAVIEKTL